MKRAFIALIALIATVAVAAAETELTDKDYEDLSKVRTKLVRMKREMDQFIKDIVASYPDQKASILQDFGNDVKVDIAQTEHNIIVKADLPGMQKDKINVTLEQGRFLKIAGTREVAQQVSTPSMVRTERSTGHFERMVELPAECMSEGIKATYTEGVLEVVIPKKKPAPAATTKIAIQ